MIIEKLGYKYESRKYPEKFIIVTYPGVKANKYLISNHGRILNSTTGKIMKTYYDRDDYERVTLVTDTKHATKRGNRSKHYSIHRLMLWDFIGPPPDHLHNISNHKNGIPCCNFIDNLEWTTSLENTNHAKNTGLMNASGINSPNRKYSEKLIRRICRLFEEGFSNIDIYEMLVGNRRYKESSESNALYCLINKLGKRIIFRDIVQNYDYLPPLSYFKCSADMAKVRKMIRDGNGNPEILKEFGYDSTTGTAKRFYNQIIAERVKCEVLFNDYRKDSYSRNTMVNN